MMRHGFDEKSRLETRLKIGIGKILTSLLFDQVFF